ncbi:M81 family metallopeptidase [Occultella gossypii]|uniref:M81 family metallopeptidase n=1 Tax=Occultella gossypii TaxID=2800820 RepID=A0ABS7S8Z4_9MICO|nr:M81 family metallopeptidase [Occultella gossypii]MBZ2196821.1 M81 family metallopeptidase [Occultella gossypii]
MNALPDGGRSLGGPTPATARLAVLGLSHEANTFSPGRIDADRLAALTRRGPEIIREHMGANTIVAGYLDAAERGGVDLVPLIFASTTPSGPFTPDAFDAYVDEMCHLLELHGPWDGVLLALHGAAVAAHVDDADGEILRRVRDQVGNVPVGVTLDLHANVSARMVAHSDVLITFRTNPHVDARDRGRDVAELVIRAARGESRPTTALTQVPAAIDILRQHTTEEPMASLTSQAAQLVDTDPRVLGASVAEGFPYADVEEMGLSVVVVTEDDLALAKQLADDLAREVWSRRAELIGTAPSPAEAVRAADDARVGPVLLLDVGDNVGGGSPGDSVVLLREIQDQGVAGALSIVQDPDAAGACHAAGLGAHIVLDIGGRAIAETGPPLRVAGVVRALHDGPFEDTGRTHAGQRAFDTGPTALVAYDDDCLVIVTSRPEIPSGLAQPRVLGVEPTERRIIIGKGVQSPLAGYADIVTEVIRVDTPGVTAANLHHLKHRNRRVPLFPYETIEEYA